MLQQEHQDPSNSTLPFFKSRALYTQFDWCSQCSSRNDANEQHICWIGELKNMKSKQTEEKKTTIPNKYLDTINYKHKKWFVLCVIFLSISFKIMLSLLLEYELMIHTIDKQLLNRMIDMLWLELGLYKRGNMKHVYQNIYTSSQTKYERIVVVIVKQNVDIVVMIVNIARSISNSQNIRLIFDAFRTVCKIIYFISQ